MSNHLQSLPDVRQVPRVKIEPNQFPRGSNSLQQLRRMAAVAHGAIDDHIARLWIEGCQHLVQQDGQMFAFGSAAFGVHDWFESGAV